MDLSRFLPEVEKRKYKVTFMLAETKIKRFVSACSEENAKYLIEQDIREEAPGQKLRILETEDITDKHQKAL